MPDKSSNNNLACPLCGNINISSRDEVAYYCLFCFAKFYIDDREESIFLDTNNLKIPLYGKACSACGLVQGEDIECCYYCGTKLVVSIQ